MPDVTIRNETEDVLNVAFRFVSPANWNNALGPGSTYTAHLASVPYTIEARLDLGHNRFSAQGSINTAFDISLGWIAGAGSVVLGGLGLGGNGFAGAASFPLMAHAIQAGGRFAKDAEGTIISIPGVFIPFYNKTYAIRFDSESGYGLWDVDSGTRL